MKKFALVLALLLIFLVAVPGCGTEAKAGTVVGKEGTARTQTNMTTGSEATVKTDSTPEAAETATGESTFQKSRLTVGAHYYPWYGPSNHWNEGYLRGQLQPAQEPFLGQYNSGDPKVTEQHIKWAKDYGIDYFIMSWWGPEKFEDSNIKNGFLKSSNISDIKFGILYESPGRLGALVNDRINFNENSKKILKNDMAYLARTYFSHPSYLKYNGKPVVYFYLSRCFGGDYVRIIREVREEIKKEYGFELFLIGDEIYWGRTFLAEEKLQTLDAFSIYNPHNNDSLAGDYLGELNESSGLVLMYKSALESAQNGKTHFIPDAMPGFNDRGVRLEANHNSIPREMKKGEEGTESTFREFLELAYKYRDPELNTILITSWNEWHEDSQIEPTKEGAGVTYKPEELTEGFSYTPYGLKDLEVLKAFKDKYAK